MENNFAPDSSAVRVALWRAMHVLVDSSPHVLEDEIGLKLIAPPADWRNRPDMHPQGTAGYRASIIARARFIEDLVIENLNHGVSQYVILGAGLDTFAQRYPEIAARMQIFEVDKPRAQAWKKQRLMDLGYGVPKYLNFVPVDFEANDSWWNHLIKNGFDKTKPAVVVSTGVSMYLTKDAVAATLRQISSLASGSQFAISFLLPLELLPSEEQAGHKAVYERARAAGTPFISFFTPSEILQLARDCGFRKSLHVSREQLIQRYFTGRPDGLVPASGEEILLAGT